MGAPLQIFNKQDRRYYTAEVKVTGKNTVTICPPVWAEQRLSMPPGSRWLACLIGIDALYYFTARVLEATPVPGYIICRPQTIYRRQRRKYVRVSCSLDITYWITGGQLNCRVQEGDLLKPQAGLSGRGYPAVVVDLSGGGLRMVTREFIPRQTRLVLEITLEKEVETHRMEGVAVRVTPVNYGSWKRYRIGVAFCTDSRSREKIIRYLFALMRRKLKDCCP